MLLTMLLFAARAADVEVSIDVVGTLAEVRVQGRWVAPEVEPDSVWIPLPNGATLYRLVATVDGVRRVREVLPYAAAEMHPGTPGPALSSLGEVDPGDVVDLDVSYIAPVHVREAGARFELPRPPVIGPRSQDPPEQSVTLSVDGPVHGLSVQSGTDRWSATLGDVATLTAQVHGPAELTWRYAPAKTQVSAVQQAGHLLVTVTPPVRAPAEHRLDRDIVWIVDRTTSMAAHVEDAKGVVHRILASAGPGDRIQTTAFAHFVTGARDSARARRRRVERVRADGEQDLVRAVHAAFEALDDPQRAPVVVVVTHGRALERRQLDELAAARQGARVLVVQVGRALMEPHPDLEVVAADGWRGLGVAIADELRVDWGDWVLDGVTPPGGDELLAGEPRSVLARVVREGTGPIRVEARTPRGTWWAVVGVEPRPGDGLGPAWAARALASLPADAAALRDHLATRYGLNVEGMAPVLREGEQIVSAATSLLRRDRWGGCHLPATRFIPRFGPGHPGVLAPFRPTEALLDGVSLHDPANHQLAYQHEAPHHGDPGWHEGGMTVGRAGPAHRRIAILRSAGTNNLRYAVGLGRSHGLGAGTGQALDTFHGRVAGPLRRDHVWGAASIQHDRSVQGARRWEGVDGLLRIMARPGDPSTHELSALIAPTLATVEEGGATRQIQGLTTLAQWRGFGVNTVGSVTAALDRWSVDADARQLLQAGARLHLQNREHRGIRHDITVGVDAEQATWHLGSRGLGGIGPTVPDHTQLLRLGAYAYDHARLGPRIWTNLGLRVDRVASDVYPGGAVSIGASGSGHRAFLTASRSFGHARAPQLVLQPGLPGHDMLRAFAEGSLHRNIVAGAEASWLDQRRLPTVDGDRIDRRTWQVGGHAFVTGLGRVVLHARFRHAGVVGPLSLAPVVDDGGLIRFRDELQARATWYLPTEPWDARLFLTATWRNRPIGTTAPDPFGGALPNQAGRMLELRYQQTLDVRRGGLRIDAAFQWLTLPDDGRDLRSLVGVPPRMLALAPFDGPRLRAGLTYEF